jgi:hypothetical protein
LNKSKVKHNLFAETTAKDAPVDKQPPVAAPASVPADVPKYATFDIKLSILLTEDQLLFVEKMVKDIMKRRKVKKERITKNTVFRCLVDLLAVLPVDLDNIPDEDELRRRVLRAVGM